MLFDSDTELSEKFWGVSRIMTSSLVELGQYKKGVITKKLDITCLDTLYKLIEAKFIAIGDFEDLDNVSITWKNLALEYRKGQKRIYSHYLNLIKNTCAKLLEEVKFFKVEYDMEDDFGGTVLGIVTKLNEGDSNLEQLFASYDANRCKKILGKGYSEFKEFYEEYGGEKRSILWGFTMVKLFGGDRANFDDSSSSFGLYLPYNTTNHS
jgi:hypothetical protein